MKPAAERPKVEDRRAMKRHTGPVIVERRGLARQQPKARLSSDDAPRTAGRVPTGPGRLLPHLRQRHLWRVALRHAAVERWHAGEGGPVKQAVATRCQAAPVYPWFPAHSWSGTVCQGSLPKGGCQTPVPR